MEKHDLLDDSHWLSLLEAVLATIRNHGSLLDEEAAVVETKIASILREERVAIDLINGHFVRYDSQVMHEGVVKPTITLLAGRAGWESVEAAYQKALSEISNDPSDAITDAGTALQEALVVVGCKGNALGALIADGRKRGIFVGHDSKLAEWVSADRSERGDTHHAGSDRPEDAWFSVHIVGALILRLAT